MNQTYRIPRDKVNTVVKYFIRQRVTSCILALLTIAFLGYITKGNTSAFEHWKLTRIESLIFIEFMILLFMAALIVIARKRFTTFYKSFGILITDNGIQKFNVSTDCNDAGMRNVVYLSWQDIKKNKENSFGLIVNGSSVIIDPSAQITIPAQIERYEALRSNILKMCGTVNN